jgi:hypothetical protein
MDTKFLEAILVKILFSTRPDTFRIIMFACFLYSLMLLKKSIPWWSTMKNTAPVSLVFVERLVFELVIQQTSSLFV